MENIHNKNIIKSITIIAGNYPAKGHQMYVFVQQLVHTFIDMGIKVTVVAPQSIVHSIVHKEKLLPKYSKGVSDNGNVYEIYRPYILTFGKCRFLNKFAFWYNRAIIVSILRKIKSEILYSHFWSSALPIYKYASNNNLPLFVACGEGDDALEKMVSSISKEQLKELSNSIKGVISVSSENKRKCVDSGLVNDNNICVYPNCVNTNIFKKIDNNTLKNKLGIKENDFVVGFVGVFTPRKGPDRVAKAIKKLNDPQIKVIFIGKPFPGFAYDFDCPGIIYKGIISHDELPKYLNCTDVFVIPTQKEGCCNAIVEALAVGLPVISSEGAFNDDILNESNSIRVNPNDVDAIADAIKQLKDNIELRKQMSAYSLSRHEEYSIQKRAKCILSFINNQLQ